MVIRLDLYEPLSWTTVQNLEEVKLVVTVVSTNSTVFSNYLYLLRL